MTSSQGACEILIYTIYSVCCPSVCCLNIPFMDLCIWNFESAKAFVYGAPFLLLLCALQCCIHAEVMCLQIIY